MLSIASNQTSIRWETLIQLDPRSSFELFPPPLQDMVVQAVKASLPMKTETWNEMGWDEELGMSWWPSGPDLCSGWFWFDVIWICTERNLMHWWFLVDMDYIILKVGLVDMWCIFGRCTKFAYEQIVIVVAGFQKKSAISPRRRTCPSTSRISRWTKSPFIISKPGRAGKTMTYWRFGCFGAVQDSSGFIRIHVHNFCLVEQFKKYVRGNCTWQ